MNYQALNGNIIISMPFTKTEKELRNSKLHLSENTKKEYAKKLSEEVVSAVMVVSVSEDIVNIKEGDYVELKPIPNGMNPHIIIEDEDRYVVVHYNMVNVKIKNVELYLQGLMPKSGLVVA